MSTTDNLEARALLERAAKALERTSNDTLDGRNAAIDIRDFLARSLAPAKELSDEEVERIVEKEFNYIPLGEQPQALRIIRMEAFIKGMVYFRDHGYLSPAPPSGAVVEDRNAECVKAWPECEPMAFDPRCCRFPKSCSCTSGSIAALDPTSGAVVDTRAIAALLLFAKSREGVNVLYNENGEVIAERDDVYARVDAFLTGASSPSVEPTVDEHTERIMELVKEHKKWVRESPLNPTFQRDIDADLRKRIKALLSR